MKDDAWESFAKADPYWAVLTDDRYKLGGAGALAPADREHFFESGAGHIERVTSILEKHFDRRFTTSDCCVDFGCGVGRLLFPMSRLCGRAIGLDVSATMRRLVIENMVAQKAGNIECYPGIGHSGLADAQFDWVNSYIVFQHIATDAGYRILESLLARVRRRGAISLHFTVYKDARAINYINDRMRFFTADQNGVRGVYSSSPFYQEGAMMMNDYDVTRLYMIMQRAGFTRILTEHEDQAGMHGLIFYGIRD